MILLRGCHERLVVSVRRLHKEIERALRLDAGEAVLGKLPVQKLTVAVVDLHIHLRVLASSDNLLDQRRRIYETEYTVCRCSARDDLIRVTPEGKLEFNPDVTDLAGKALKLDSLQPVLDDMELISIAAE